MIGGPISWIHCQPQPHKTPRASWGTPSMLSNWWRGWTQSGGTWRASFSVTPLTVWMEGTHLIFLFILLIKWANDCIVFFLSFSGFISNLTIQRQHFPTDEDQTGAAKALLRLQDTYRLDTNTISTGDLPGKSIYRSTPHLCGNMCTWGHL